VEGAAEYIIINCALCDAQFLDDRDAPVLSSLPTSRNFFRGVSKLQLQLQLVAPDDE
jgi:hypothetical protein